MDKESGFNKQSHYLKIIEVIIGLAGTIAVIWFGYMQLEINQELKSLQTLKKAPLFRLTVMENPEGRRSFAFHITHDLLDMYEAQNIPVTTFRMEKNIYLAAVLFDSQSGKFCDIKVLPSRFMEGINVKPQFEAPNRLVYRVNYLPSFSRDKIFEKVNQILNRKLEVFILDFFEFRLVFRDSFGEKHSRVWFWNSPQDLMIPSPKAPTLTGEEKFGVITPEIKEWGHFAGNVFRANEVKCKKNLKMHRGEVLNSVRALLLNNFEVLP